MGKLIAAVPFGSPVDPCCCPPPSCDLFWQVKSGSATLCGFSEFTTPSTPPKKYKRIDFAGSASRQTYGTTGCSGSPNAAFSDTWSGFNLYDPTAGCALTTTTGVQARVFAFGGSNANFPATDISGGYAGGTGITQNFTRILSTLTSDLLCHDISGTSVIDVSQMSVSETLSQEDTEDDAIGRANAGIGAWTPCTPFSESDCSAFKALRGAGVFSLAYRSAQVQYQAGGTIMGAVYETTINLQRRAQGTSDPFLDFATITDEFVGPSGTTYLSSWFDIPATSGFEVAANVCSIVPL